MDTRFVADGMQAACRSKTRYTKRRKGSQVTVSVSRIRIDESHSGWKPAWQCGVGQRLSGRKLGGLKTRAQMSRRAVLSFKSTKLRAETQKPCSSINRLSISAIFCMNRLLRLLLVNINLVLVVGGVVVRNM